MGFVTGALDSLECVLRKIGMDDSEFTNPGAGGRVQFYEGNGDGLGSAGEAGGAVISTATPIENSLWGTQAEINAYDMVYFACQGDEYDKTAPEQQIVIDYANAGGRLFTTHYSYVWLFSDAPFSTTATWAVQGADPATDPQTGYVNTTFPEGLALAQWLQNLGASTTLGQIQIATLRHDFTAVTAPSLLWMSIENDAIDGNAPMHYTFNTPVGSAPASQCGKVLFNDYHVEDSTATVTTGVTFPAECSATADDAAGEDARVRALRPRRVRHPARRLRAEDLHGDWRVVRSRGGRLRQHHHVRHVPDRADVRRGRDAGRLRHRRDLHAQDVPGAGPQLRQHLRRLQQRHQLRHVHGEPDLRRWRAGQRLRRAVLSRHSLQ